MRWFNRVMIATIALMAVLTILAGWMVAVSQPQAHAQQKNAYWPYSVETSVKDR